MTNTQTTHRADVIRGAVLIGIAAALWATTSIAAKFLFADSSLDALTLGWLRLMIAFPVFFFLMRWERRQLSSKARFRLTRRNLLTLLALGAFQAAYQSCYLLAVDLTGAGIATLIALCLSPVLVAIFSAPLLGERPGVVTILALMVAIIGTVMLVSGDVSVTGHWRFGGIALAILAAFVYAGFTMTSRYSAGGTPVFATAFGCFLTGAVTLLPVVWLDNGFAALSTLGTRDWLLVTYIGIVPTCVGYVCFFTGMKTTPATTSSIIVTLEPLFVALLAWLILGEVLGTLGLTGAIILTAAVIVASRSSAQLGKQA